MTDEAPPPLAPAGAAFWCQSLACLLADQLTKYLAVTVLDRGGSVDVIPGLLSLSLRHNTGAAFGLFDAKFLPLVLVAAGVIVLLGVYGPRAMELNRALGVGLALEWGGAAGNFLDRVWRGHVVDFIDVHIWPVFNLADVTIVLGVVFIGLFILHHHPSSADPSADEEPPDQ